MARCLADHAKGLILTGLKRFTEALIADLTRVKTAVVEVHELIASVRAESL